jgi:hypothetical protein
VRRSDISNSERTELVLPVAEEEQDVAVPELEVPDESAGLPFFAGRTVTLSTSPGFIDVLLMPSRVRI